MSDTNNKIRLAGLWAHRTRNGLEYFSGTIGGAKLLIFANDHKYGDNDPDYVLYLAPNDAKRSSGTTTTTAATSKPAVSSASAPARRPRYQSCSGPDGTVNEDSIPY